MQRVRGFKNSSYLTQNVENIPDICQCFPIMVLEYILYAFVIYSDQACFLKVKSGELGAVKISKCAE